MGKSLDVKHVTDDWYRKDFCSVVRLNLLRKLIFSSRWRKCSVSSRQLLRLIRISPPASRISARLPLISRMGFADYRMLETYGRHAFVPQLTWTLGRSMGYATAKSEGDRTHSLARSR